MKNIRNLFAKDNKKDGFTLIELILFMGLFSVLMVVLLRVFTTIIEQQAEVESYSAVESDRLYLLSRLGYDIARATAITVPSAVGNQGQTLTLTIGGLNYTYTLTSGNLTLTTPSGTDILNQFGTTITTLNFRRLGNVNGKNTINFSMTIRSKISRPQGFETKTINTTFGTR
ncbi:hypothetical protein BH09PAT2_BH09PAT2_05210 [soil metagenome]